MFVYGTKINCDIEFPLDFPKNQSSRYQLNLSSPPPYDLIHSITCGLPLYRSHGREVYLYSNQVINGSTKNQPMCYEVKNVLRFYWRGNDRNIYYSLDQYGNAKLLGFWFVHLFLPLYFTFENMYEFLHGGAVKVDGKSIIFLAPSMGGKSTITDFFIKKDTTLISDDKIPTFIQNNQFMVAGSHPYHRPYRKFEELGFHTGNFLTSPSKIHIFYSLKRESPDGKIHIKEINGFQKFNTLLPNYLLMFDFHKEKRLNYLTRMLNQTPVYQLQIPWNIERLEEVYHIICTHCLNI